MKKYLMIILVSCIGSSLTAQKSELYLTKSLSGQDIKNVEVQTSGGNISVESVAAAQTRIEVFARPSNMKNSDATKEEIQKRMNELYDLKIDISGNKVTASAKPKSKNMNWKNGLSISFKVFVTENISTELTTSGGNIELTALRGEQNFTTSGGNLYISNIKGKLDGTTSGGNILVKDCDNDIKLTTSGGNIEATNCKGSIKLTTSGGEIKLENMDGNTRAQTSGGNVQAAIVSGDLYAHTSGGNIDLKALSCNVETGTSGGDIKVAMLQPKSFVRIRNSSGKIELQLPAGKGYDVDLSADKIQTGNLANFSGR